MKYCENSQSTNNLPQIWLKVQILFPPPSAPGFLKNISSFPEYNAKRNECYLHETYVIQTNGTEIETRIRKFHELREGFKKNKKKKLEFSNFVGDPHPPPPLKLEIIQFLPSSAKSPN